MKKQKVKSLALNKKAVSNLQIENAKGGNETDDTLTQTFVGNFCNCPAPSRFRDFQTLCLCL